MTTTRIQLKNVVEIVQPPPRHWVGNGFHVHSMFSYDESPDRISPFLLLDYIAAEEFPPSTGAPRGVGEHPHRGFETVTILRRGEVEHRDSAGHQGRIGPGDVQWMTAASGIVHEEKHGAAFTRTGGVLEGVQLWVNLPAKYKMSSPKYQDLTRDRIPVVDLPRGAGTLRVIAGDYEGTRGPASTFTPIRLWEIALRSGSAADLKIGDGHTAALLAFDGRVSVNGEKTLEKSELAVLSRPGEVVRFIAERDAAVLLMSGEPIPESLVGYGPFVMNSHAEIGQAIRDYESGAMGTLK